MTALDRVRQAALVIWDFDGVIKDSVDVKTTAFLSLFAFAGPVVQAQVRAHHETHGGMSRFDKIPYYLDLAGEVATPERTNELCESFARHVMQAVIDAPWVPGVESYLRLSPAFQCAALVSATPVGELRAIVEALGLSGTFSFVSGAPTSKRDGVRHALEQSGVSAADAVFVGDAAADYDAALAHGVPFILRRHATNEAVFSGYNGPSLRDFTA